MHIFILEYVFILTEIHKYGINVRILDVFNSTAVFNTSPGRYANYVIYPRLADTPNYAFYHCLSLRQNYVNFDVRHLTLDFLLIRWFQIKKYYF